jgi:hypothetical protein
VGYRTPEAFEIGCTNVESKKRFPHLYSRDGGCEKINHRFGRSSQLLLASPRVIAGSGHSQCPIDAIWVGETAATHPGPLPGIWREFPKLIQAAEIAVCTDAYSAE